MSAELYRWWTRVEIVPWYSAWKSGVVPVSYGVQQRANRPHQPWAANHHWHDKAGVQERFVQERRLICLSWLSEWSGQTQVWGVAGAPIRLTEPRVVGVLPKLISNHQERKAHDRVSLTLSNPSVRWNSFVSEVQLKPPRRPCPSVPLGHSSPPCHSRGKQSSVYLSRTLHNSLVSEIFLTFPLLYSYWL